MTTDGVGASSATSSEFEELLEISHLPELLELSLDSSSLAGLESPPNCIASHSTEMRRSELFASFNLVFRLLVFRLSPAPGIEASCPVAVSVSFVRLLTSKNSRDAS